MTQPTSVAAFMKLRPHIRDMHWGLLEWMFANQDNANYPPPWTGSEIKLMAAVGGDNPHKRLAEMARGQLTICLPKGRCRVTNRDALHWDVPAGVPSAEVALLAKKKISVMSPKTFAVNTLKSLKQQMLADGAPGSYLAAVTAAIIAMETGTVPE